MSDKRLDASWKGWLKENIDRQCDPEELLGILLRHQFSLESIRESMGEKFPAGSGLLNEALRETAHEPRPEAFARPSLGKKRLDDSWKGWLKEN
ncbi:MAG: hypothetical protein ACREF9_13980, partial [Opitutaceae bacterium]